MSTITITFGDCAENHKGMQLLGTRCRAGFQLSDLQQAQKWLASRQVESVIHDLGRDAYLLVAQNGVSAWCHSDRLYQELIQLEWDQKAYMYGRVVKKKARYNLCFDHQAQEPDYANGKGRIIPLTDVPFLAKIHGDLPIGEKSAGLVAEGNLYYDQSCGIGWHGDSERKKVIGLRLGERMPLDFQWYYNGQRIDQKRSFDLGHGDLYIMSQKTVGSDWKRRTVPTLRHAAGAARFRA